MFVKHLVECNCVLPQFLKTNPPVFHQFVVFSELNPGNGDVVASYAQCPNCLAIHRVTEVGESRALPKETLAALPKKEELKLGLPPELSVVLESYHCDLPTWQEVRHILDHQMWGSRVVLSKDSLDGVVSGKVLVIAGGTLFRIDGFTTDE